LALGVGHPDEELGVMCFVERPSRVGQQQIDVPVARRLLVVIVIIGTRRDHGLCPRA
jgi:hypothetical protein